MMYSFFECVGENVYLVGVPLLVAMVSGTVFLVLEVAVSSLLAQRRA